MSTDRPSQSDAPMLDADEGDPHTDQLGADLDDSGTDGRPGPDEGGDVQRAPADPEDPPVEPDRPTNPA